MRILHVIPYMHPSAGGPPVVVENFVRETNRLGHTSEIITTSQYCENDQSDVSLRLTKLAPTTFLPHSKMLALFRSRTSHQLREGIRAADLVHLHTLWSALNILVRRQCAKEQRPYVLMPHGMLDPYSLSVRRWRKRAYLRVIERANIQAARRIIFTTADEEQLAFTEVAPLPRSIVIPLGGDAPTEDSEELASVFFRQFPAVRGRRQLLFLGRLHFKKGLDRILTVLPEIVQSVPDVLLTIVGDGAPEFDIMLRKVIAARNLGGNVLMTGRLDGAAKWGAYAAAELFLLPSRQENFAVAVAEAMHMSVPVIISDRVNTWPYVKESGAGLVLSEKQILADLASGIATLLKDPERGRQMGRNGQAFARQHLTWAKAASRLARCYDEVIADVRFPRNS